MVYSVYWKLWLGTWVCPQAQILRPLSAWGKRELTHQRPQENCWVRICLGHMTTDDNDCVMNNFLLRHGLCYGLRYAPKHHRVSPNSLHWTNRIKPFYREFFSTFLFVKGCIKLNRRFHCRINSCVFKWEPTPPSCQPFCQCQWHHLTNKCKHYFVLQDWAVLLRKGHEENTRDFKHAVRYPHEKKETIHTHGRWPAKIITEQEILVAGTATGFSAWKRHTEN